MTLAGRCRLAGVLALLALLAAPALPGVAGQRVLAHAQLVASSPGSGTVVTEPPDELRLVFSEPLEPSGSSLDVLAEDGAAVLVAAGEVDPDEPYALVVERPSLVEGVYTVEWRTLSTADGHSITGSYTFGVGNVTVRPGSAAGAGTAELDPIALIGRWLTYLGLLLALGLPIFHRVVIRAGPMPVPLLRLVADALAIAAVATVVATVAAGLQAGSIVDHVGTRTGLLGLARAAVAGAGAAALHLVGPRVGSPLASGTGLAGIVLLVLGGHAAALATPAGIVGQVVHVTAAAVWISGVAALTTAFIRPQLVIGSPRRPAMRTLVPRFSALALASIGLVALSGVHAAWLQTGELVAGDSQYGRILIIKSVIAVGALVLGGLNYLDGGRMRPWLDGMPTRLRVESLATVAVLAVTAALATTPPRDAVSGVPIEPIPDASGAVTPGMGLEIAPGRPGLNRALVTATDDLAGVSTLELVLERIDTGESTRVPLVEAPEGAVVHPEHGSGATDAESAIWLADALVLPRDSRWDGSVRILSDTGTEITRQRYAFTLGATSIVDGRRVSLVDPAIVVGAALLLGGGLGVGLGLGGMALPRCEPLASRVALVGGGSIAVVLGLTIGVGRLIA